MKLKKNYTGDIGYRKRNRLPLVAEHLANEIKYCSTQLYHNHKISEYRRRDIQNDLNILLPCLGIEEEPVKVYELEKIEDALENLKQKFSDVTIADEFGKACGTVLVEYLSDEEDHTLFELLNVFAELTEHFAVELL